MKQLELFERPKLVRLLDSAQNAQKLEVMAMRAISEDWILFGETRDPVSFRRGALNPSNKLEFIKAYTRGVINRGTFASECNSYLIQYGQQTIGCAFLWEGWIPEEQVYENPEAELVLLDSAYRQYKADVIHAVQEELEELKKGS